jgi:O-antigen ligase
MAFRAQLGKFTPAWVVALVLLCLGCGLGAGASPALGLEIALALTFVVAAISSLTLGLCLFVFLSFLEVQLGGAALSVMKGVGLLLFLSWMAASSTRGRSQVRSFAAANPVITWAAVALVGWSTMSIAWADSTSAAASSTERYLLNALLLPIVFGAVRRREHFVVVAAAFVAGAAASAAYGFVQTVDGRLAGTIGDPNEEAAVLVAALALTAGLFATLPKESPKRFWCLVAGLVCVLGLLNTVSRGGLVALVCMLIAGAIFGGRWRSRAIALLVAGVTALGIYYAILAPGSARSHAASSSTSGRSDLWKVGWRMFQANPILGVGSGNFNHATIHYVADSGALTRADLIIDAPKVAHNVYLEVLDDLGIPGLAAFLTVLVASIALSLRAAKRYELAGDTPFELMSRCVVLAIIGILAADFFLSGEYSKQLWLLLALPAPLLALAPPIQRASR